MSQEPSASLECRQGLPQRHLPKSVIFDARDLGELPEYAAVDRYVSSRARLRLFGEYLIQSVGSGSAWITTQRADDSI